MALLHLLVPSWGQWAEFSSLTVHTVHDIKHWSMDLPFDQPVKYYSFAKFTVVKGPAFKDKIKPVTVIFNQPDQLLEEYYNNLSACQPNLGGEGRRRLAFQITAFDSRNRPWCYSGTPGSQFCISARSLGLTSFSAPLLSL